MTYSITTYSAPRWLPGGHLQTLYTALFLRGPKVTYRRERWEWPDGDFTDADWVDATGVDTARVDTHRRNSNDNHTPILVLFHGLEGSSQSHYARGLLIAANMLGWRGVVAHFRGCSGEPNRLPRAYFAGDTAEVQAILTRIHSDFPHAPLYAAGVSLGGNALLKWLGDTGESVPPWIKAAAAVSAPVDMRAAGHTLDSGFNRLVYTRHFLNTLKKKALDKAATFPGTLNAKAIRAANTFQEFDTLVTARLHGFKDAADYWSRASSKPVLKNIAVPTLLINARNDPFLPASALPGIDDVSRHVCLEQPETGGHVAFPVGTFPGNIDWLPQRILEFMQRVHA